MILEEYYEKNRKAQLEEAAELVREYRAVYHKDSSEGDLSAFS